MECPEYNEMLIAYAENSLDEKRKGLIVEHLQECPACRMKLNKLNKITQMFRDLPKVALPMNFQKSLQMRLKDENIFSCSEVRKILQYGSGVLTLLALTLLGGKLIRDWHKEKRVHPLAS